MNIPQTARTVLHVRLQVINRILEADVAFAGQLDGCECNVVALAAEHSAESIIQLGPQRAVTGQKASVDQAQRKFQVAFVKGETLAQRVRALANAEPVVPKRAEEGCEGRPLVRLGKQKKIDIGVRKKVFPSVTPDGEKGCSATRRDQATYQKVDCVRALHPRGRHCGSGLLRRLLRRKSCRHRSYRCGPRQ